MTITRATIEVSLISRCAKAMALVDMDTTTVNGTNADLTDPIATAFMELGCQPQNIGTLTDYDLISVGDDQLPELLDRAERRTLVTILNNLELVDLSLGPRDEALGQIGTRLSQAISRLDTRITRLYGDASLSAGTLSLDFAEKD